MEKQSTSRTFSYYDMGLLDYQKAWDFQKELFQKRLDSKIDDSLLLLEHPHTYTLGKSAHRTNLLLSDAELERRNISVFDIDRGGDITYHGPGQLVGYVIMNLNEWEKDTHKYLRTLEKVIIETLSEFGIIAGRDKEHTGVWINDKKICAIGIKVSRWITMHGFALNINTDMDYFNGIIPCGIKDKGVTSIQNEFNKRVNINKIKTVLIKNYKRIFNYNNINIKTI